MADYDDFLYDDYPFAETHPDWLATLAALFGLQPAPATGCRVLELGCGLGGNLLGMGVALPESEFVGVDLSANQVAVGQAAVEAIGLRNVHLHAMDIQQVDESLGAFDYIVCHGVYSWVPPDVQAAILRICRRQLAPGGVGYISYNVRPGWNLRSSLRDMLHRHIADDGTRRERAGRARAFLRLIREHVNENTGAGKWMAGEIDTIETLSDRYLFYEYLVEHNEPLYFEQFVERIQEKGLNYLSDASFRAMLPDQYRSGLGAALSEYVRGHERTEQYLDYVSHRYFRRSLVCHREAPLSRAITPDRLRGMWVASALELEGETDGEAVFLARGDGGHRVSTSSPAVCYALLALADADERGMPYEALEAHVAERLERPLTDAERGVIGGSLLEGYANGYLTLARWRRPYTHHIHARPRTSALARYQASEGGTWVTNLRHESVAADSVDRVLLAHMDGTRGGTALFEAVMAGVAAGKVQATMDDEPVTDRAVYAEIVEEKLKRMGPKGLLVDPEGDPVA